MNIYEFKPPRDALGHQSPKRREAALWSGCVAAAEDDIDSPIRANDVLFDGTFVVFVELILLLGTHEQPSPPDVLIEHVVVGFYLIPLFLRRLERVDVEQERPDMPSNAGLHACNCVTFPQCVYGSGQTTWFPRRAQNEDLAELCGAASGFR